MSHKKQSVKITDLLINSENPRFDSVKNQKQALSVMMKKIKLYIPGPLEYYPFVKKAMKTIIHHRSEEFSLMMKRIRKNFSKILDSHPPVLFSSSGTGAINAVFRNFVDPTKKTLIFSSGKFANRILKIMEFYGINPTVIRARPG